MGISASESHSNLVRVTRERAERRGDDPLYAGEANGPSETSAAALEERARAIAALLQESVPEGERALLLLPPGLHYVTAFFGCLFARVVAVPAYPPDPARVERTLPRLCAIAQLGRVLRPDDERHPRDGQFALRFARGPRVVAIELWRSVTSCSLTSHVVSWLPAVPRPGPLHCCDPPCLRGNASDLSSGKIQRCG